jgi:O-antigen/teichoic acid export membrane protein
MGLRTLAQAVVFLVVARVLGAADYGAFAAILALSTAFGCLSGFGTQILMVRNIARNRDCFAVAWTRTLAAIAMSVPILFSAYIPIAWFVLPAGVSFAVVALIGLADLSFAPIGLAAVAAYQGHERHGRAAHLSLVPVLPRLAGALLLLCLAAVLPEPELLRAWSIIYVVTAFAAALYAWKKVRKDLGIPSKLNWEEAFGAIKEGWVFAIGSAAVKLYADIDKTMLARLVTMEAAGAYSAGYRVAELATIPILSLVSAVMPRFFLTGINGVHAALVLACRILPVPLAYCLIAGVFLYWSAGALPFLLGTDYVEAVAILQWLAWIPALSLPRLLLQSLLIGSDRQNYAVNILAAGGLFNIALNILLIPVWSWRGAVAATYAAEFAMASAMSITALRRRVSTMPTSAGEVNT